MAALGVCAIITGLGVWTCAGRLIVLKNYLRKIGINKLKTISGKLYYCNQLNVYLFQNMTNINKLFVLC